jgi:hypothetical protein
MSRNRRKNANTVRVATFVWWLMVFVGLSVLGLSYVSIKNQAIAFGDQRRGLERQLRDLVEQNRALGSQVTALTSRSALQKQLSSGFIKLIEIDPTHIVRLHSIDNTQTAIAASVSPSTIFAQK